MAPRTKKTQKALLQRCTITLSHLCAHHRRALVFGIVILALALVLAAAVLGILRLVGGHWLWASAETQQAVEVERIVEAVGKLMLLPEGETPLIATITDAATLGQEQPFYIGAVDGDQLLLYGESLRAIIYSPSRNIIVNVGPVELPPAPQAEVEAPVEPLIVPEVETDTDTPEESPSTDTEAEPTP